MKLRITATDRIVLKLSKLEFKSTRRKKIDFGNELTVLNKGRYVFNGGGGGGRGISEIFCKKVVALPLPRLD